MYTYLVYLETDKKVTQVTQITRYFYTKEIQKRARTKNGPLKNGRPCNNTGYGESTSMKSVSSRCTPAEAHATPSNSICMKRLQSSWKYKMTLEMKIMSQLALLIYCHLREVREGVIS